MPLNLRQQAFVDHWLQSGNASEAYLAAGYAGGNSNSVSVSASKLLNSPKICEEIAKRRGEIAKVVNESIAENAKRLRLKAEDIYEETAVIASSSVDHYVIDDDGELRLAEGVEPCRMRAIQSVEKTIRIDQNGNREVKVKFRLWDKNVALNREARHLGIDVPLDRPPDPEGLDGLTQEQKIKKLLGLLQLALTREQMSGSGLLAKPVESTDSGRTESVQQAIGDGEPEGDADLGSAAGPANDGLPISG